MRRVSAFAILMACLGLVLASFSHAATAWQDEFTRNENPATGWGTYQSTLVAVNSGGGYGYLTLTGGNTWGNADTDNITLNTDTYNQLTINVAGLQDGLNWKVSILHDTSITTDLGAFNTTLGAVTFNYASLVRAAGYPSWSGTQTFKIRVFVEKYASGTTATIDYIRIGDNTTPTLTPTVTPTPTPTSSSTPVPSLFGYSDEFTRNENPATGWGTYQSTLVAVNSGGGYGYLTLTGGNTWGNADSDNITLNTDTYNQLTINVAGLQDGLNWKVSILHDTSITTDLGVFNTTLGAVTFNYASLVRTAGYPSWSGTQTFKIRVFVEKYASGTTATIDYIRIGDNTTPTMTPTATTTPTPVTSLLGYTDEFTRNENPATGWGTYQSTLVAVNSGGGYGYLTLTGGNTWGNADSDNITLNTDTYSQLTINMAGLQDGLNWKVSILHDTSITTDLGAFNTTLGSVTFNYASLVRTAGYPSWSGTQTFKIRVFVEKYASGTTATIDYINISEVLTPTATQTRTMTPTMTITPSATLTPSTTRTRTPTVTVTNTLTSSPSPTVSNTPTSTRTETYTVTDTGTTTPSPTVTVTPTLTATTTYSVTATGTRTTTPTFTPTLSSTATSSITPTGTITLTGTDTPVFTATLTPTQTVTSTYSPTLTITSTRTATPSASVTYTGTQTMTYTATPTLTATQTLTSTVTSSSTPTGTITLTGTDTPVFTSTITPTQTVTSTGSPTLTITSTRTATPSASVTNTGTLTMTYTATSTMTATQTPTSTATNSTTPTGTITVTGTGTPVLSATFTPTTTITITLTPTVSVTPSSTRTFTASATRTQSATVTLTCTQTQTATQTVVASSTPTNTVTLTSVPSVVPTTTPTVTMTSTVQLTPTVTIGNWAVEKDKVLAYPNPAKERVCFAYTVLGTVTVTLDLYQISGERVAHITESRQGNGVTPLTTVWEAANVAPGIYLSNLIIKDESGQIVLENKKKVALIK